MRSFIRHSTFDYFSFTLYAKTKLILLIANFRHMIKMIRIDELHSLVKLIEIHIAILK
jgi:hypothetical protein